VACGIGFGAFMSRVVEAAPAFAPAEGRFHDIRIAAGPIARHLPACLM
jgi:hypothetical protein